MIIGLAGRKRSGKDSIGEYLERRYGFQKLAFADPIKDAAACIFQFSERQLHGDLKEEVDEFWQDTPRNVLQLIGTELFRQNYRKDIWIQALLRRIKKHNQHGERHFVVTDVRFPNEADTLSAEGAFVVRVVPSYEGYEPSTDTHASEVALDNYEGWDYVIENDGTLEDLHQKTEEMFSSLLAIDQMNR